MFWKRISQIFGKKNTEDLPEEARRQLALEQAMTDMQRSIAQSEHNIAKISESQAEMLAKVQQLKKQIDSLQNKAINAAKQQNQILAKDLLQQKALAEQQLGKFEQLYHNISQHLRQLEGEANQMKIRLEEYKTKETLLKTQLQASQNQAEMANYLNTLEQLGSEKLNDWEEQVTLLQTRSQALNELTNTESKVDKLLSNQSIEQDFNDMLKQVEAEEKQKIQAQEEARFSKIRQLFELMPPQNEPQNQNTDKDKQKLMDDFFAQKQNPTQPNNNDKQKLIDDFFKNSWTNLTDTWPKRTSAQRSLGKGSLNAMQNLLKSLNKCTQKVLPPRNSTSSTASGGSTLKTFLEKLR